MRRTFGFLLATGLLTVSDAFPPPIVYPHQPMPPRDHAREAPYSDREIRRSIEGQFFGDPFLNAFDVEVEVQNGVVTLSGRVDNSEDRRRAEANAYQAGARRVINYIKVRP